MPVCPHSGGVGLCELVQHLILFDYICVSGSLNNRYEPDLFLSPPRARNFTRLAHYNKPALLFCSRMCEYVDHLHEHFASPVVIHEAHYMPPKVSSTTHANYSLQTWVSAAQENTVSSFTSTVVAVGASEYTVLIVFRILDIHVRCWNHQCRHTSTQKETYGSCTRANEDWNSDIFY